MGAGESEGLAGLLAVFLDGGLEQERGGAGGLVRGGGGEGVFAGVQLHLEMRGVLPGIALTDRFSIDVEDEGVIGGGVDGDGGGGFERELVAEVACHGTGRGARRETRSSEGPCRWRSGLGREGSGPLRRPGASVSTTTRLVDEGFDSRPVPQGRSRFGSLHLKSNRPVEKAWGAMLSRRVGMFPDACAHAHAAREHGTRDSGLGRGCSPS